MPAKDVPYHSDIDGLVHGSLLCPGQPTRSVTTAEALEWLALPSSEQGQGFLWLHFALSNSGTLPWLNDHLDLPESVLRNLQGDESSSRLEVSGGLVVAVVKDVVYDFSLRISEIATLFGVLSSKFLITLRNKQLRTVERLRQAVRSGEEFRSSTELLARLLLHQADVLEGIQRETNSRVDAMEDSLLANRKLSASSELATLRRILVRLQRLLSPEPAALYRLVNRPPDWMEPADLADLREAVDEFSVVIGDIRQLNERIKLLQEELGMLQAERTNRTLFTLTLVTVLAIPFNVIGAMFGMNVGGIPFNQDPMGFWEVVGLVVVVTVAAFLIFRRPR
jgi:zinc transporter